MTQEQNKHWQRIRIGHSAINYRDQGGIRIGFTEKGSRLHDLHEFFSSVTPLILHQVHSSRIVFASNRMQGNTLDGDGWLLSEHGVPIIIQTADCVPLSFWNREHSRAGILHIGWRGLHSGIIDTLKSNFGGKPINPGEFGFFLGPCIERDCYEVGPEMVDLFRSVQPASDFFSSVQKGEEGDRKFFFDLKGAIAASLIEWGASVDDIEDSGLCTFCNPVRFPSYRRDGKTGKRIYNFLLLK